MELKPTHPVNTAEPSFAFTSCTPGTDDVKQKTSLFSVHGKLCFVLFPGFCSFVLRHLCLVHKVNAALFHLLDFSAIREKTKRASARSVKSA